MSRRLPVALAILLPALALLPACGGSGDGPTHLPPLDVAQLAGDWLFANVAGDTVSLTIAVDDTTITGSGFVTNTALRDLVLGGNPRVPIVVTGWASPTRYLLHSDLAIAPESSTWAPFASIFTGQLDAHITDPTRMTATLEILVNGSVYWSESQAVPMRRVTSR